MRLRLSSVAYMKFWSVIARPGLEPVLLEPDGRVRVHGEIVEDEHVDSEVAWGTGDLFVERGSCPTVLPSSQQRFVVAVVPVARRGTVALDANRT